MNVLWVWFVSDISVVNKLTKSLVLSAHDHIITLHTIQSLINIFDKPII